MIATEWEVDVDEDEMWEPWNQTILLDIVVKEMGYGWIIPKAKPHLSIGYLMPRRKAEQVKRITAQIKIDNNISGETTQTSHLIPFYHSGEVARGRVFLVGDAAGACNPANAAGISWGMLSGQMAVLAIVLDMDTSGNPGPQVYSRLFLKQLIGEYNTAKAMRNALLFDMSIRPFKAFDTTSTLDNFLQEAQADLHYDQWRADHPWRHRFGAMINPFIEKALIRSVS
jgi:flavin-dependent dehydrogenase